MIRLLVFDVDGTLYDMKHHEIPASCRQAIAQAKAAGIRFAIATGRTHYALGKALNDLKSAYILGVNRAVVVRGDGTVLARQDFSGDQVRQVNDFCRRHQAGLAWKFIDHVYLYQHPEKIDWLVPQMNSDVGREPFVFCPTQDHHLLDLPQSASVHADPEAVAREFSNSASLSFLPYSHDGFDVVLKGVDKGRGLQVLMQQLGLRREETAAFGDNRNDLEMLAAAGTAVAMGNAIEEVKAAADWVTAPTWENGIALALRKLGCIQ